MKTRSSLSTATLLVAIFYRLNYLIQKDVMPNYVGAFGFIVVRVIGASILFWGLEMFVKNKKARKDFINH